LELQAAIRAGAPEHGLHYRRCVRADGADPGLTPGLGRRIRRPGVAILRRSVLSLC